MTTCVFCGRPITRRLALIRDVLFFSGILRYDTRVATCIPYCCSVDCARKQAAGRRLRPRPYERVR